NIGFQRRREAAFATISRRERDAARDEAERLTRELEGAHAEIEAMTAPETDVSPAALRNQAEAMREARDMWRRKARAAERALTGLAHHLGNLESWRFSRLAVEAAQEEQDLDA